METIFKKSQEQAIGAWVDYLNQVRLDRLTQSLATQNLNFEKALNTIDQTLNTIQKNIIDSNRGGSKGMHGFIAEIAECGLGNAKNEILGKVGQYTWINDNGPDDFVRGIDIIQQKFVQSGGHLSLNAIEKHLAKYPDYLKDGYLYQIPKDHYDKIIHYMNLPDDLAKKLSVTDKYSYKQWRDVQQFFKKTGLNIDKIEPAILNYDEVQVGKIEQTIQSKKEELKKLNKIKKEKAIKNSKPTFSEGMKATTVGALSEGAATLIITVLQKKKEGKRIQDLTQEDWIAIVEETGLGTVKGGIRGASVYFFTNTIKTPGAVASALTTAVFGIGDQIHLLRNGEITEQQFLNRSEELCIEVTISAISSMLGQTLIPVPILGTLIGNSIGIMMYRIGKEQLSKLENELIQNYFLNDITLKDEELTIEYQKYIHRFEECFNEYLTILSSAFDPKIEEALDGSIRLAKFMGISDDQILDSHEKISSYFLE